MDEQEKTLHDLFMVFERCDGGGRDSIQWRIQNQTYGGKTDFVSCILDVPPLRENARIIGQVYHHGVDLYDDTFISHFFKNDIEIDSYIVPMENPRLYTVSKVPDCDDLIPDTLYSLGSFPNIDAYVRDLVSHLFPNRSVSVEYMLNTTGIYDNKTSCITCLADGGALFLTNIGEETKMYKEYDENCVAYVASVKRANVICCPENKCMVGFGMTDTLDIKISDGDTIAQSNNEYTFVEIESLGLVVKQKLGFAFFNDLIYHQKSLVVYDEIVTTNGLYKLSEHDTSAHDTKGVLQLLTEMPNINRFSQRLLLPAFLTTTTCDWITQSMRDNRTEVQLTSEVSDAVCKYLEFVIDHQVLGVFSKFYGVSLELFAVDIVNIVKRDAFGSDKRISQFSMDIGLDDGTHSFTDGTKQSLQKGDGIVYWNATRNHQEKVATRILTIEFNIRVKKAEMRTVL